MRAGKFLTCLAVTLAVCAPAVMAEPHYFTAGVHAYRPDSARSADNGVGLNLAYGIPLKLLGSRASLELSAYGSQIGGEGGAEDFNVYGLALDLRALFIDEDRYGVFAVGGIGATDNNLFDEDKVPTLNGGLGLLLRIPDSAWLVRTEVRTYLQETDQFPDQDLLFDHRAGIGFEYLFDQEEAPEPAVAAAAPADGDEDGDGIPDRLDQCPGTLVGTMVLPNGCPASEDSDGDGIVDQRDRCPGTPLDAQIDNSGCALYLDSDGDGITDARDRCPGSPPGAEVDFQGCQLAPPDADGDGVPDNADRCPGTMAGVSVNPSGCPLPVDVDGDGVGNASDLCPDTPPRMRVDANGCVVEQTLSFNNINFNFDSSDLTDASKALLNRIAEGLKSQPDLRIEIGGHTDGLGTQEYNLELSQQRAAAVRDYLVGRGVAAGRLESEGYGEFNPVADNETEAGRAQNRRVEFQIIKQ